MSPLDLAQRLWEMMDILQGEDPEMFKIYHAVAQNLLDFCGPPTAISPLGSVLG
jgi:hypothetical protein